MSNGIARPRARRGARPREAEPEGGTGEREIRKSNFSRARRGFGLGLLVSFQRGPGVPRGPSGQARGCARRFFSRGSDFPWRVRLSSLSCASRAVFLLCSSAGAGRRPRCWPRPRDQDPMWHARASHACASETCLTYLHVSALSLARSSATIRSRTSRVNIAVCFSRRDQGSSGERERRDTCSAGSMQAGARCSSHAECTPTVRSCRRALTSR